MVKKILHFISIVLMNLWVYPLVALWTLIGSLIAFPVMLVLSVITGWSFARITHLFIWIYGRVCLLIFRPFTSLDVKDMSGEKFSGPAVIVLNHYSFFDTYLISSIPVSDVYICLRSWPFKMIWYSFVMKLAQYIDLESLPWEQILSEAKRVTAKGGYLVVFPEGHRSRTGETGRYHSGAFKLSTELDIPVLPMCVSGTQKLLPPTRWWFKPAHMQIQLLDPVYPDGYSGEKAHMALRKDVRKLMVDAIEEMES
jgi:1-acyl-sn-glycerol-3-phosphate acyltransferase